MRANLGKPLMEDQVEVFERCVEVLDEVGEEGWRTLVSQPCPDIKMSMKYIPPKRGE